MYITGNPRLLSFHFIDAPYFMIAISPSAERYLPFRLGNIAGLLGNSHIALIV